MGLKRIKDFGKRGQNNGMVSDSSANELLFTPERVNRPCVICPKKWLSRIFSGRIQKRGIRPLSELRAQLPIRVYEV